MSLHSWTRGGQALCFRHEIHTHTQRKRHLSHKSPKIRLSCMAAAPVQKRCCPRLPVIFHVIFLAFYIPQKELKVRLLPTEHFLLNLTETHMQLKQAVFFPDWLASELNMVLQAPYRLACFAWASQQTHFKKRKRTTKNS